MTEIASQIPAYQGSCFEQRTSHIIAGFAPIESRVRDHDLNSADAQSEEADGRDAVRHADKRSMRGRSRISELGFVRHVGSIAGRLRELAHPVATLHTNFAPPATQIDNTATLGVS